MKNPVKDMLPREVKADRQGLFVHYGGARVRPLRKTEVVVGDTVYIRFRQQWNEKWDRVIRSWFEVRTSSRRRAATWKSKSDVGD